MPKIRSSDGLTPKMRRFCEEYIIDFNGAQASIRAGYKTTSGKTASQIGTENLNKPGVQLYLSKLLQERSERTKITADRVLQELACVGFSRITKAIDFDQNSLTVKNSSEIDDETIAAIQAVKRSEIVTQFGTSSEVAVKFYNKIPALTKLGEHLGMFKDDVMAINTLQQYGTVTNTEKGFVFEYGDANSISETWSDENDEFDED